MATREQLIEDFADHKYATGEKFARLINSMKAVQEPVADPAASGTSLSFIDSISQDADGKITATKKTLDLANAHELNPFKGWWKTGDTLPTDGFDGAYLYFKDTSELTGQTTIYRWNGTAYADTGTVVDTSNVQTFDSGQAVNEVKIKDASGQEVTWSADVLSAEAGAVLNNEIGNFVKKDVTVSTSSGFDTRINGVFKAGEEVIVHIQTNASINLNRCTLNDGTSTQFIKLNTKNKITLSNDGTYLRIYAIAANVTEGGTLTFSVYKNIEKRLINLEDNSFSFIGTIATSDSIDNLSNGIYYLQSRSDIPATGICNLIVQGKSDAWAQTIVELRSGKAWIRGYINSSWSEWRSTYLGFTTYKGALNNSNNIDELYTEGEYWFRNVSTFLPLGTFPTLEGRYYLLEIISVGNNYVSQRLFDLDNNKEYRRTRATGNWSTWIDYSEEVERIDNIEQVIGEEKPNLLPKGETITRAGVTFTVNSNGSITLSGQSTTQNASYIMLQATLSRGMYALSGWPSGSTVTTCWYRVIRADSSFQDIRSNDNQNGRYIFEVTDESEVVKVYIWARVDYPIPDGTTFYPMIQKYPFRSLEYVPYDEFREERPIYHLIDATDNNWANKKMCVLGDSIAKGSAGSFVDTIGAILGLEEIKNYAVGGSRMAYYGDGNTVTADMSVVALYDTIDTDADIVLIHAGTNDWASQVPLGNTDSTSNLEFYGALNIIMSGLREMFPTALIIFDSILPRIDYDAPTHGGSTMTILTSQYSQAIKTMCEKYHFVFYDAYKECGFDFAYDYYHGRVTTNDGLHPNTVGANILGRKIAGFIKWH